MTTRNRVLVFLVVTLLIVITLSCRVYIAEPTQTPIPNTPTPIPNTPTPIPPTSTSTPIPATYTPTPIPLGALLMGEWSFEENGDLLFFEFNDGQLTISFEDESIEARYTIDCTQDPMQMDWIIEDGDDIQMIFEFVDENTVRLFGSDPGEPRPTSFGEDTIILTRVTDSE